MQWDGVIVVIEFRGGRLGFMYLDKCEECGRCEGGSMDCAVRAVKY